MALAQGRLGNVSILNPKRSHAFAQTLGAAHKTDGMDACLLAYYGQSLRPRPSTPASASCQQLRGINRALDCLQADKRAYLQRIEDEPTAPAKACYKRTAAALDEQIKQLQHQMEQLISSGPRLNEDARRIRTVPGLGPRSAQTLLAEFGGLRLYNRDEIVCLAGLYPRQHESGTSVRKRPRLARGARPNVRAVLYMAAMVAIKHNPHIKQFARRLSQHGKCPMQVPGAIMRKLLLIAHALIVKGEDYNPPCPC